jgi:hypothetical protein
MSFEFIVFFLQLLQVPPGMQVLVDFSLDSELVLMHGFGQFVDLHVLDAPDFVELGVALL